MRRIGLFLLLIVSLATCTPQDITSALRLLHGQSRVYIIFEARTVSTESDIPAALDQMAALMQRRLDLAGINATAEGFSGEKAVIVVQGDTDDLDALIALMTRPGRVEFTDLRSAPAELLAPSADALVSTSAHPLPEGQTDPVTGEPYPTMLDAVQVVEAQAKVSPFTGDWDIVLTFSPEHGAILADYTAANIGTTLGILIDGKLLSAPTIQVQIGEQAQISGIFSEAEARELAAVIGGGTLPFALTVAELR